MRVQTATGWHVIKEAIMGEDGVLDIRLGPSYDIDVDAAVEVDQ